MRRLMFPALSAVVATLSLTAPMSAQESPRVSGTITLSSPGERVQMITTRRARLGVTVNLQASRTDSIGALILGVTPNGPAAKAGIRSGDIVLRLNGRLVTEADRVPEDASAPGLQLVKMAAALSPGDTAQVQFRRGKLLKLVPIIAGDEPNSTWTLTADGKVITGQGPMPLAWPGTANNFSYRLQDDSLVFRSDSFMVRASPMMTRLRPTMPRAFMLSSPLADLELAPLNPELGRYFGTSDGVLVIDLPEDSQLGLKPGDVVLTVDGREIRGPGHLINVLASYGANEKVTFQIMRQKSKQTVTGVVDPQ